MGGPPAQVDLFISYTAADRAWAEWIAWQLEAAGSTTLLQAWDFRPGSDFVHQMQQATQQAKRTIAVVSSAYFGSRFGEAEWRVAFGRDPTGKTGVLVPVRVEECYPPGLLSTRVYVDLVGLDEAAARQRLLAGLREGDRPGRPATAPAFPGYASTEAAGLRPAPMFPGLGPAISNLAPRNPNFTGRVELLVELAGSLAAGTTAVVAAHGLGGVGKSQLALEYCYRHAADYQLVWWVTAESPTVAVIGLAALGPRLGLPPTVEQVEQVAGVLDELARREGWLLVFDNAERPGDLDGLLPTGGRGHVLVTSRNPAWGRLATPLRVDVLAPTEAEALLLKRTGDTDRVAAAALAEELGGLPLALEQAAAYCEQTSLELAGYLDRYRRAHARLLQKSAVATTWRLNLDQAAAASPAGVQLLRVASFLAPESIPPDLFGVDSEKLPADLAQAVGDELLLDEAVGALYRYSLVVRDYDGISLHRLVQAVARADLADQEADWAKLALRLVWTAFPAGSKEVATWPICERLLPHALAVAEHAERLNIAGEVTGGLLHRASIYLRSRGRPGESRPVAERALSLTQQALGSDHPDMAARHNNLGNVLHDLGDLTGARTEHERAIGISKATLGPDHPDMAAWHNDLGLVLRALGDLTGARTELQQALATTEASLGPDHRIMAIRHNNLGYVLRALGDLTGARTEYERALEITEATLGPDHPDMAALHTNLGNVLADLGDLTGARAEYERALEITEATLGPDHPDMAICHSNLGNVLAELDDLTGARTEHERAIEIGQATLGPDHPDMATRHNNLGYVLRDLGDLASARGQLERALEIGQVTVGPNHPTMATFRRNLDSVLQQLGEE
jgi:tetratricopeptide (TPR) repeat protein